MLGLSLSLVIAAAPTCTFDAYTDTLGLSLPVPTGWRFNASDLKPSPSAPVRGKPCSNHVWFDFIPGATPALTRQLIDTESLEATIALRRWDERTQHEVTLAGQPAARLEMPDMPERSIYFLASAGGTLVVQVMTFGPHPPLAACTAKHEEVAAKLTSLFLDPAVQARAEALSKTVPPPTPKVLEPVPATLDESHAMLEKELSKDALEELKHSTERALSSYHLSLGMDLRNRWGLWGASPLARYFRAQGVLHPEEMSGVIIRTFWRRLNGRPTELEREVADIVHRRALRTPPEAMACGKKPSRRMFQLTGRDPEQVLSVFYCDAQSAYWVWELSRGWYQPEKPLKKRFDQLRREHPGLVSGPLEE